MRRTFTFVLIGTVLLIASCSKDEPKNEVFQSDLVEEKITSFAITNVNVITMKEVNEVTTNQTLLIDNGSIEWMGSTDEAAIADDLHIIDANNGYLMPGLADMHVHWSTAEDFFLFVGNGVTVVREMWGSNQTLSLRDRVLADELDLPQIFAASPGMNGAGGAWEQFTPAITDVATARLRVSQYKEEGYDFIKVYNKLELDVYNAIIEEAAIQGIKVIGHVPSKVDPEVVFKSGQVTTEHFLGFGYFAASNGSVFNGILDDDRVAELANLSVQNNIWHVATTEVGTHSPTDVNFVKSSPEYNYISQSLKNTFESGFHQGFNSPSQAVINQYKILNALKSAGSKLLLGTDAGFGYIIPGYSIHDELAHYVQAGFTPYEAIETATVNAARFLGMDNLIGTVEVGKRADLVLLRANPLEDISNTRNPVGVVLRGAWLSEESISNRIMN